jgi:drug/metabolite transporter (DMT)-like permease
MRAVPDTPQAGLVLVTVGFLIAPGLDVFAKLLTANHTPGMVGLLRFSTASLILLCLLTVLGGWSRPSRGHLVGGLFLGLALISINAALEVMPIANALAIFFVEPLVLTALSALILKERIGWRRIAAVAVGLIGAMVVLRPNLAEYGPAAAWPLVTALCFACYMLVTRVMTLGGHLLALQFWTSCAAVMVIGTMVLLAPAGVEHLLAPSWPTGSEWTLVLAMGALGVVGHQTLAHGLKRAEASLIAPMQYLEIVSGTLFGWWVFSDFPDFWTWVGTGIIVSSGIYVLHREQQLGRKRETSAH